MIEVRLNPDVEPTGSDLAVVNAARRSFNKRSEWKEDTLELKPEDRRLLQFLARGMTAKDFEDFLDNFVGTDKEYWKEKLWQWRNTPTHDTPFNHCFLSFEVKAPIFVARQLVKHEYLIMSEFSRRYITDDIQFYQPDYWRQAADNKKQGSSDEAVDWHGGMSSNLPAVLMEQCVTIYNRMIHEEGICPEQARMVLPQSTMTEWTWSGTLGAFAKMCTLRLHPEAQYEARLVAEKVYGYLLDFYPISAKALVEGADIV